jgi:hypothetical protein
MYLTLHKDARLVAQIPRVTRKYFNIREPRDAAPADAYFGRAEAIIKQSERIKRNTIEYRRLHHRKIAA